MSASSSSLSIPVLLLTAYLYSKRSVVSISDNPNNNSFINRHGDSESKLTLIQEDWLRRWNKNQTQWHRIQAHPTLTKYLSLFPQPTSTTSPSILVPLCGKTV